MEDITVQELHKRKMDNESLNLIDVREVYEHEEFNIGGELAPLQSGLPLLIAEWQGPKDEEIIVYCRSGNRSNMAKMMLTLAGFTQVRNLVGGMLAWKEAYPS